MFSVENLCYPIHKLYPIWSNHVAKFDFVLQFYLTELSPPDTDPVLHGIERTF